MDVALLCGEEGNLPSHPFAMVGRCLVDAGVRHASPR